MKRKDLTAYIRQEIINELSEGAATDAAKDAGASNPAATAKAAVDAAKKDSKGTATIVGPKGTKVIDRATPLEEDDLDEMARKAGSYRPGSKFEEAKEIYATGLYADLLKAVEEAGENGVTQKELGSILSRGDGSSLNLILKNLRTVGILSGGPLAAAPKPEKGAKEEEPEDMEDVDIEDTDMEDTEEPDTEEPETEEEPEEEETPEEEPVTTTKASDDLGKWADELAGLKKQLKVIMDKYRDASGKISDIEKYKQEVGNIPQKIKALDAKLKSISE